MKAEQNYQLIEVVYAFNSQIDGMFLPQEKELLTGTKLREDVVQHSSYVS